MIEEMRLPNSGVASFSSPPYKGYVVRPFRPEALLEFLNASFERWFEVGSATLISPGLIDTGRRSAKVAIRHNGRATSYFAKKYDEFIPLHDPERARRRYFRAVRAWNSAWLLIEHGISTPKPVAIVKHDGIMNNAAFLTMLEWLEGYQNFNHEMLALDHEPDGDTGRGQLIEGLVELTVRMHSRGVFHGDMSQSNILVRRACGEYEYMVTDLDHARIGRPFEEDGVIEDLARLTSTFSQARDSGRREPFLLEKYVREASSKWRCKWSADIIEAVERRGEQMLTNYAADRERLVSALFAAVEERLGILEKEPDCARPEESQGR